MKTIIVAVPCLWVSHKIDIRKIKMTNDAVYTMSGFEWIPNFYMFDPLGYANMIMEKYEKSTSCNRSGTHFIFVSDRLDDLKPLIEKGIKLIIYKPDGVNPWVDKVIRAKHSDSANKKDLIRYYLIRSILYNKYWKCFRQKHGASHDAEFDKKSVQTVYVGNKFPSDILEYFETLYDYKFK